MVDWNYLINGSTACAVVGIFNWTGSLVGRRNRNQGFQKPKIPWVSLFKKFNCDVSSPCASEKNEWRISGLYLSAKAYHTAYIYWRLSCDPWMMGTVLRESESIIPVIGTVRWCQVHKCFRKTFARRVSNFTKNSLKQSRTIPDSGPDSRFPSSTWIDRPQNSIHTYCRCLDSFRPYPIPCRTWSLATAPPSTVLLQALTLPLQIPVQAIAMIHHHHQLQNHRAYRSRIDWQRLRQRFSCVKTKRQPSAWTMNSMLELSREYHNLSAQAKVGNVEKKTKCVYWT